MKKLKVLNCYAGIGGNRKLWDTIPDLELDITAVEINQKIADIYHDFFPQDKIVIGDAHQYLLEHFTEFDFIWSSPPCPSHSRINKCFTTGNATNPIVYPDLKLYEEVLLLKHYFTGKWCVENVVAFYKPLIPCLEIDKHYFWTNFNIRPIPKSCREHYGGVDKLAETKGFNISQYSGIDKVKTLRNCVKVEVGLHVLKESLIKEQASLFD